MSKITKFSISDDEYHVVSIDKTNTPDGAMAGNWYRYIIEKGKSKIEGYKCGSFTSVAEHAMHVTEDLNQRAESLGGYVYYRIVRKQK